MRILLTANASYAPPRGGSTRSNLAWLSQLAGAGHACRVVAAGAAEESPVKLVPAAEPARRVELLREQIRDFTPDWVLVSSEDLGHALLREAHRSAPGRVVYLAHTPQFYPFGPASWNPDPRAAELVARAPAVVAIGHTTARYIERHTGLPAAVIHPPIYGRGPYRQLGSFGKGVAAMINPCAVKGMAIFAELARRFPKAPFGVLEGWGTTAEDRRALARLPNVTQFGTCRDIEEFLERVSVLLVPSLWYEGFGLIVVQAMLYGIPVVASDAGGLAEAKLGTRFVIPVRAIESYQAVYDEHGMPKPIVPAQDLAPWEEGLAALLRDRAVYEEASRSAREAALGFVNGVRPAAMEEFLESLVPAGEAAAAPAGFERLSAARRALLLRKLRKQAP
jgi:glycosyltransferase involved in cell wall biosynthesis